MSQSKELISIETITPLELFKPGGADRILDEIKERVKSIVLDVSTEKGRDEIRSIAAKIAKSKTALDSMGKELKSEWKAKCDGIDAERRKIWEELETLQHQVRQPLTDFENAVKQRIDNHEKDLIVLANWGNLGDAATSKQAEENLVSLDGFYKSKDWEEFKNRADTIFQETRGSLITAANNLKKQEDDRAELEMLRRQEEERKQKEREEQIAREAAERAARTERERIEAENKRQADEQARREADKKHKAEIHNEIKVMLIEVIDVSKPEDELAKNIIIAIATGKIPHVKITY